MLSLTQLLIMASLVSLEFCGAKNVVMIPPLSKSYLIYHANIGQALIELGHNVSICVPDYLANKGLVPHKKINIIKYGEYLGDVEARVYEKTQLIEKFWAGGVETVGSLIPIVNFCKGLLEQILSDQTFIASLRDLKPDFFIIENFMFTRNILVLPYKLDVPFGLIGTYHDYFISRTPFSPAADQLFFDDGGDRKSFLQRVQATILSAAFTVYDIFSDSDVVSRYAPEKPSISIRDIALKAEIFITEIDHILDYPRTSLPNTKLVGGSSVSEAKPLSGDMKHFVDKSPNGIVVVSFGSGNVYIPDQIRSKMANAFLKLNLNVIWKINGTFEQQDKILALNWIPQNDLLGHTKTKVFVSHCGKNGQYEALYHGVPILCLPMYGDQFYNSKRIAVKEFGHYADIREITSEKFSALIQEIADNPKYRNNIQKASKLFKELYKVPSKEAAYWFDHVMKYGGSYMRSSGQQMPLYQYLLLDVMAFLFGIVIVFLVFVSIIFRLCWKLLTKYKVKTD
ncbi:UDP-glucuronosyltransferase 1-1 [Biomphalaria glabrata]|nr:UDP-glucuronosyltransferase 1-1-like [Biomphalaria glabrata]